MPHSVDCLSVVVVVVAGVVVERVHRYRDVGDDLRCSNS